MTDIKYKITFFSNWHCGSGLAAGADTDELVIKDRNGLPYVPGRTIKGLLREAVMMLKQFTDIPEESIIIVSLLHDICKTYYYTTEMRNKKVNGVWEQVPFYTVDDKIPYGHGEKSVMMIEEYIKLTPQERYSIRWHMGPFSGSQDWGTLGVAFEKYPLALALFEADMEATHILEKEA